MWVAGVAYGPGDSPPADVAARITNPAAWEPDDSQESPAPTGGGEPATPAKKTAKAAAKKAPAADPGA